TQIKIAYLCCCQPCLPSVSRWSVNAMLKRILDEIRSAFLKRFPVFPLSVHRSLTIVRPGTIPVVSHHFLIGLAPFLSGVMLQVQGADRVLYEDKNGGGNGKNVVLISGDEEYRSEQAMPMLAKILAVRHGFRCTVLFPINPTDGTIDPITLTNIPGMETLDSADLCIMAIRFRELPDYQMKHFVDFLESGKPIIALRTSTHAFAYNHNKQSAYAKYDWRCKDWPGGFGQQVLGETWVDHHGAHGKESTHGLVNPE